MKIVGPKGACPTTRGWIDPTTSELLKAQKISQADVDSWYAPEVEEQVVDLSSMTKAELQEHSKSVGVEVGRYLSKSAIVAKLKSLI